MSFLVHHILDNSGNKRGTLFAQGPLSPMEVTYQVGWAMCNKKDNFDKKAGVALARSRAETYEQRMRVKKTPKFVLDALPLFLSRCDKYFKGKHRPAWCWEFYGEG